MGRAGIAVDPGSLSWRAEFTFVFPARPDLDAVVTVFFGERWSGEPRESEEMAPEWFDIGSVPLDRMWDDEVYWLARVLAGETLAGVITCDEACKLVARAELTTAGGRQPSRPGVNGCQSCSCPKRPSSLLPPRKAKRPRSERRAPVYGEVRPAS